LDYAAGKPAAFLFLARERAVFAAEIYERIAFFLTIEPHHASDEDRVIAAFMHRMAFAFEHRKRIGERRRAGFCFGQREIFETVFALLGKTRRHLLMFRSENADRV